MRSTPDLYDDFEDIATTCSIQFRDFGGKKQFSGPIRTVKCRNDNQLFRALAAKNGWSGVVINGAVRDVEDLSEISIGIKALGVNPAKSVKKGEGTVDVMLHFGGARFEPGHWIYCDESGVLIAPKELA
jgi:regulator of ribonuclease activity A